MIPIKSLREFMESIRNAGLEGWLSSTLSLAFLVFFLSPVSLLGLSYSGRLLGSPELALIVVGFLPAAIGVLVLSRRTLYLCLAVLLRKNNLWPRGNLILKRLTGETCVFPKSAYGARHGGEIRMPNEMLLVVLTLVSAVLGSCGINGALMQVTGTPLFLANVVMAPTQPAYLVAYVGVVAPAVETVFMIAVLRLLIRSKKITWKIAVISSAVIWSALHALANGIATFPAIFWLFLLLSLLFLHLSRSASLVRSYFLTFAVHMFYNLIIFALAYFGAQLMPRI